MQSAWGLVAGFIALVFALVGVVLMAERLPSADRLGAAETVEGIDVPVIGTVGDFPDPAHRHVVNVKADGTIALDRQILTFSALRDELQRRASLASEENPRTHERTSREAFLLRIDGALPWGAAFHVYSAVAAVAAVDVLFVVRHEGDGREGALAMFLPTGGVLSGLGPPTISVRTGGGKASPQALFAAGPFARDGDEGLVLSIDPRLPTRTALELADALLRTGERVFRMDVTDKWDFAGADYASELLRPPPPAPGYTVVVSGDGSDEHAIGPSSAPMHALSRVRGRLAGVTWGNDAGGPRWPK
jgi:hypothetical protein